MRTIIISLLCLATLGAEASCWLDPVEAGSLLLKSGITSSDKIHSLSLSYDKRMAEFISTARDPHYRLRPKSRQRKLQHELSVWKSEIALQTKSFDGPLLNCFRTDLLAEVNAVTLNVHTGKFEVAARQVEKYRSHLKEEVLR